MGDCIDGGRGGWCGACGWCVSGVVIVAVTAGVWEGCEGWHVSEFVRCVDGGFGSGVGGLWCVLVSIGVLVGRLAVGVVCMVAVAGCGGVVVCVRGDCGVVGVLSGRVGCVGVA